MLRLNVYFVEKTQRKYHERIMTLWCDDSHDQTEMFWTGSDPALRHSLETQAGYSMLQMSRGEAKVKTKNKKKTKKKTKRKKNTQKNETTLCNVLSNISQHTDEKRQ